MYGVIKLRSVEEAVSLRGAELGGRLLVEAALVSLAERGVPLGDGVPVGEILPVPGLNVGFPDEGPKTSDDGHDAEYPVP
eukprot:7473247-Pyramimonas_sp.AAC.1